MGGHLFTEVDAWCGGFYEVALELGPRSDDRLRSAVVALWQHPDLEGCYLDRNREPGEQERVSPASVDDSSHLLGVARLPNGLRTACGSCVIHEDDGRDWLDFYIPMGSLANVYPAGGFPAGTEADWPGTWRSEVEDWLAEIGRSVGRTVAFQMGLVGFEVSGADYAAHVAITGIPAQRFCGYLWPVGNRIEYRPRSVG
jgi:hypothetical protein